MALIRYNPCWDLRRLVAIAMTYQLSFEEFKRYLALMYPSRNGRVPLHLLSKTILEATRVAYTEVLSGLVDSHTAAALSTFEVRTPIEFEAFLQIRQEMKHRSFSQFYTSTATTYYIRRLFNGSPAC
jgi:hypothetical protein